MLGINCLIKNPDIQQNLKDIIEVSAYDLAAKTGSAKIKDLYNVIRKSGLEMDIQTLTRIYENTFDTSDPAFSTEQELADARNDTYKKLANLQQKTIQSTIGKDKPSVAAAASLMKSLVNNITEKTDQKVFQERLTKAAKRILGVKNTKSTKTTEQLIEEVLSLEKNNDFYGLGQMENARTLFDELGKELEQEGSDYGNAQLQQYGQILRTTTYDFLASQGEAKKMIDGVLKDSGFIKEITVKGDKKQVIDWDKIISQSPDFRNLIKSLFTAKGISDTNAQALTDGLTKQYNEMFSQKVQDKLDKKNEKKKSGEKAKRADIDRLVELDDLGIFGNASQDALAKLAGLSNLKQDQVKQLRQIISSYKQGMALPMGKWSPTFERTMQRQIESFISSFENKRAAISVMQKISAYMQFSNAAILANPQNIVENILSGLGEAVTTAFINPRRAWAGLSDFANKLVDYMAGGVRVGEEKANAFNTGGNIEDLYNRETKGLKRADSIISLIPRVLLGAFDNGFKHQIVQSLLDKTIKQSLVQQGATPQEANLIMNEIYYGNNEDIEKIAKSLTGQMVSGGVKTSTSKGDKLNTKEKIIASELALANMLTEGKFFQDTIAKLVTDGKLNAALKDNLKFDENLLLDIRNAAHSTASKGLGHQADNELLKLIETRYDVLNKNIDEAKKKGEMGSYVINMTAKLLLSGVNKFRSGGFNWMFLQFQKSSGIALLQTLITDVAMGKKRGIPLSFDKIDFSNEETRKESLSKYMALRQRLVREIVMPLVSYSVTTAVLLYIKGSGDDDEKRKKLRDFKNNLDSHPFFKRWVNKVAPGPLYVYMENINPTPLEKIPTLTQDEIYKLNKNGIEDISLSNLDTVSEILSLSETNKEKIQAKLIEINNQELPSLVSMWYDGSAQWQGIKKGAQPNPFVQYFVDQGDIRKGDKAAVAGSATGNILNLGGVMKSYDLWKGAFTNPVKIPGEYKLIKPEGFGEAFMQNFLTKDLYKKAFVTNDKLKLSDISLPHIGAKTLEKLRESGIEGVTRQNIDQVAEILKLNESKTEDILNAIEAHEELVKKVKQ